MHDPEHHDAVDPSAETTPPSEPVPVKPGGFGVFADVYRARWAANHPNMRRTPGADEPTQPPPPPADSTKRLPHAEDGTRLLRPGER
jgi:hypothetical protein